MEFITKVIACNNNVVISGPKIGKITHSEKESVAKMGVLDRPLKIIKNNTVLPLYSMLIGGLKSTYRSFREVVEELIGPVSPFGSAKT